MSITFRNQHRLIRLVCMQVCQPRFLEFPSARRALSPHLGQRCSLSSTGWVRGRLPCVLNSGTLSVKRPELPEQDEQLR